MERIREYQLQEKKRELMDFAYSEENNNLLGIGADRNEGIFFYNKKLKTFRELNNLSQTEMGERIRVSQSTVSSWERLHGYPNEQQRTALKDTFKLNLEDVFPQWLSIFAEEISPTEETHANITFNEEKGLPRKELLQVHALMNELENEDNNYKKKRHSAQLEKSEKREFLEDILKLTLETWNTMNTQTIESPQEFEENTQSREASNNALSSIKQEIIQQIENYKKTPENCRSFRYYMLIAQLMAVEAAEKGNYGVGAVLVIWYKGRDYIFAAGNNVFTSNDPRAHAENSLVLSLEELGRQYKNNQEINIFENLYEVNTIDDVGVLKEDMTAMIITTIQPCTMICEESIIAHNRIGGIPISLIFWGADDAIYGGFTEESIKKYPIRWQDEFKYITAKKLTNAVYIEYMRSNQYLPVLLELIPEEVEMTSQRIYEEMNTIEKQSKEEREQRKQEIVTLTRQRLDLIYESSK